MRFNIDTTPEKYFGQMMEVIGIINPFTSLRKRQREVFAEILYYNHLYQNADEDVTSRLVFDHKTKEAIANKLRISKANLYNIYNELRQADLLLKGKDGINPKYKFRYLQHTEVTFAFKGEDSNK
jgi:predicted transcriptional regulator